MKRRSARRSRTISRTRTAPGFPHAACLFTNTPDEHFVIDRLPDRAAASWSSAGFSGHGFKFCSAVGEMAADLALNETARRMDLFAIDRWSDRGCRLKPDTTGDTKPDTTGNTDQIKSVRDNMIR